MFWRTLLTTVLHHILFVGEDESWEEKKRPSRTPFFSARASEVRSFTRVENGALVSLGSKGTGMFPRDEKILQAQVH